MLNLGELQKEGRLGTLLPLESKASLGPALISIVQQSQFGGTPLEDRNLHLPVFLDVCDTLKLNGCSTNAIRQ